MDKNCNCFQSKKAIFLEYAIPEMIKSPEYKNIDRELDVVLLMADRMLSAFQEDLEFHGIWEIAS